MTRCDPSLPPSPPSLPPYPGSLISSLLKSKGEMMQPKPKGSAMPTTAIDTAFFPFRRKT